MKELFAALVLSVSMAASPITTVSVQDLNGRMVSYSTARKVTVVVFVSTRCPISNAFNFRLNSMYKEFAGRTTFLVLDSNVNESIEEIRNHAHDMEYDFPVFKDVDNHVADLLAAKATPESFVIDGNGAVAYRGYIEDSPNPQRAKDKALRLAIQATLEGKPAPSAETHPRGCAIRRLQAGL